MILSALLLAWCFTRQVPEPPLPADDLQWIAPPDCPDRQTLLAGITRRLGRALEPGQVRVLARTIAVGPRNYRLDLELTLGDRHEARSLTARTCAALVDAAALLIALAIDAEPEPEPTSPAPRPPLPEPPPPIITSEPAPSLPIEPAPRPIDEPPIVADEPAPITPRRRGPGGFLRLHGLGEVGALPGPTGGLGLVGGLLWPRFRLELHTTYLAPHTVTASQIDVRASLFAGALLGCARPGRGAFEFPLCGGLEVGGVPALAEGPGVRTTALGRWLAVVLGVGVAWRVHPRIGLWAALQGLAAVQRPSFVLRDPGPERVLFDPGVLSARLALGVELRFGDPR
jgi:hypothetical protein